MNCQCGCGVVETEINVLIECIANKEEGKNLCDEFESSYGKNLNAVHYCMLDPSESNVVGTMGL